MTVRILQYEPEYDVVPQAIFWRPLKYFTLIVRDGEDGLDMFKGASFAIGNEIHFDLRVYRGHLNPEFTVTLYLPLEVTDDKVIAEIIDRVMKEMVVPMTAAAWKRGQPFQFGKLERQKADRLVEDEARTIVLKIAGSRSDRTASMELLRAEVPKFIQLSAGDLKPSPSRKYEQLWQQIVRNVAASHPTIFNAGLARKIPGGIEITDKGMAYLKSIGFLDTSASDLADFD
jgi:hypothetical protein